MNRNSLKNAVATGAIEWQRHSLERMMERDISRDNVRQTLLTGEIIEDYAEDKPFPSALFLGRQEGKRCMSLQRSTKEAAPVLLLQHITLMKNISARISGPGGNHGKT